MIEKRLFLIISFLPMDTINIYRLHDPLTIQLLQQRIEAAAVACPTGGFWGGYALCTVYDNGFWTLQNDREPGSSYGRSLKSIEEAVALVAQFMKEFDEAMQGRKPARPLNAQEKAFDWSVVHPKYRPVEPSANAKPLDTNKPTFFDNAVYIGGRSISIEKDEQKQVYYRLVYGIAVKPSKDEEAVMVEDVEVVVEVSENNWIKRIEYFSLPIKKSDAQKVIYVSKEKARYILDEELSVLIPFIELSPNEV